MLYGLTTVTFRPSSTRWTKSAVSKAEHRVTGMADILGWRTESRAATHVGVVKWCDNLAARM